MLASACCVGDGGRDPSGLQRGASWRQHKTVGYCAAQEEACDSHSSSGQCGLRAQFRWSTVNRQRENGNKRSGKDNGRKRERESCIGRRASREFRAGCGLRWREQAAEARRGRHSGKHPAQEAAQCLSAPAHQEQLQGAEERMQGLRGGEHLPAPAHQEQMQGVRGGEHLPAPTPGERMQEVRGRPSARTSPTGANAKSAGGRPSASTSAARANPRSAGG